MKLEGFLDKNLSNHYLKYPHMDVYVRSSKRIFIDENGYSEFARCLDIVNINVAPRFQNKGIFGDFLLATEKVCADRDIPYVVVENVLNKHLRSYLERKGYRVMEHVGRPTTPTYSKCVMNHVVS